jgi:hypothetical protein
MNHAYPPSNEGNAEQFARSVALRLTEGTQHLPYDISERLRASRMQALARRKKSVAVVHATATVHVGGHSAALGTGPQGMGWWQSLLSALPIVALLAGLVAIQMDLDEVGILEVAQVDAALLADDLPPAAYSDPGFVQFLKTSDSRQGD